jgi:hypothetical protein
MWDRQASSAVPQSLGHRYRTALSNRAAVQIRLLSRFRFCSKPLNIVFSPL